MDRKVLSRLVLAVVVAAAQQIAAAQYQAQRLLQSLPANAAGFVPIGGRR
jgi:hypothetical protein